MSTAAMTLDEAQQQLGDAGYEVRVYPDTGSIIADIARGRHSAVVVITPRHTYQLVTQWRGTTAGTRRMTEQYWPNGIQSSIDCAHAVAGAVAKADEADVRKAAAKREPAVIGDELAAEADQAEAGIDFPGLEEACYEAPDAEPAQGDAEQAEAVSA
jgi:hypothetical protein